MFSEWPSRPVTMSYYGYSSWNIRLDRSWLCTTGLVVLLNRIVYGVASTREAIKNTGKTR